MRVLVVGASGYIASRSIPALLDAGHDVIAGCRTISKLDAFYWRELVGVRQIDVLDEASVRAAVTDDIEAILYLVHGLAGDDFRQNDRRAARSVQRAVDAAGVRRIVYVSGIIPDIEDRRLSEHLRSRLEVERILSESRASTITLRAAMIMGTGSTSYALMGQLSERLPLTVVPDWMRHRVEPVAVSDLAAAIAGAFTADDGTRHYDVGGGEPLLYPDLISRYLRRAGRGRPSVEVPLLPQMLVAEVASRIADIPRPTVRALIESLREDMIARDDGWRGELVPADYRTVGLRDCLERAAGEPDYELPPSRRDPLQELPGDPRWARTQS